MRLDRVIFATITWARTEDEERLLRAALSALSRYDRPITVADGGSRPDFIDFLRALPNVALVAPERPGLVGQTLSSLRAAFEGGADFIVYTESDKHHFFEHKLADFIEDAPDAERFGVGIAARDESSFATFPTTQ